MSQKTTAFGCASNREIFLFNALPKLVLELFILASQKGRYTRQTGQYQCSFTNLGKLSQRYSPGETPPHTAWVHFSHLEHSMPKWLFLTAFNIPRTGGCLPLDPRLTFTSPARNNTKLTHRPLQKSRLTDLCCCLAPWVPPTNNTKLTHRPLQKSIQTHRPLLLSRTMGTPNEQH